MTAPLNWWAVKLRSISDTIEALGLGNDDIICVQIGTDGLTVHTVDRVNGLVYSKDENYYYSFHNGIKFFFCHGEKI